MTVSHNRKPLLGNRTWPAYWAAGFTAAYGLLKLYWVLGGTALWDIAPLPPDMIEKARIHTADPWFEATDVATVVLAALGVPFAIATAQLWGRFIPRWGVLYLLWPLSVLMLLRAAATAVQDIVQLVTGTLAFTGFWDLILWSPFFLLWGLLWGATVLTYMHRTRTETVPAK